MTPPANGFLTAFVYTLLLAGVATSTGCASGSYATKGAAKGATTGAVAGAVGGMVSALVFGGDVVEAGARGAVYGGTTGAVAGGISGAEADRAVAAQKQAEREAQLERLRKEIGTDAYNGVVALADCKHEVAIANARVAAESNSSDYVLAGLWVEALTEADRRHDQKARALLPQIVARDRKFKTEAEADAAMRVALDELANIRVEYGMPAACAL